MLKKLGIVAVTLLAAGLGGCAHTTDPTTGVTTYTPSPQIAAIEDAVIQDAILACSFEPTIATVGQIIATIALPSDAAIAATAKGIADRICAAVVAPKSAKLRGIIPTVNGIEINGSFVTPAQRLALKRRLAHRH